MITLEDWVMIKHMHKQGVPKTRIARELGVRNGMNTGKNGTDREWKSSSKRKGDEQEAFLENQLRSRKQEILIYPKNG